MRPFAGLIAVALLVASGAAAADEVAACIEASEAAQRLRDRNALIEARDQFGVCSRDVCPRAIRADCIQQRSDVDAAIPSLVFRAKNRKGEDVVDVQAWCDGAVFASQLDGKPIPLNPGPHAFRFEIKDGAVIERMLVVGEGEKHRLIVVEAPAEPTPAPITTAPKPIALPDHRLSLPGLVLAGIGVAAAVPMTALWVAGTSDINQMRGTCAPSAGGRGCAASRVNADRTQLVAGDVFLGVAVAGAVAGTALLLTGRSRDGHPTSGAAASLRFEASPTPGGVLVGAYATF